MKGTFACIQPRRYGKTTFLLKQVISNKGNSVVAGFNHGNRKFLMDSFIGQYKSIIKKVNFNSCEIKLVDGRNIRFIPYLTEIGDDETLFIDELSLLLKSLGKIGGYTDTALRVNIDRDDEFKRSLEECSKGLSEEQYQLEVKAEFKEK